MRRSNRAILLLFPISGQEFVLVDPTWRGGD
jgi:hypothetical protein